MSLFGGFFAPFGNQFVDQADIIGDMGKALLEPLDNGVARFQNNRAPFLTGDEPVSRFQVQCFGRGEGITRRPCAPICTSLDGSVCIMVSFLCHVPLIVAHGF